MIFDGENDQRRKGMSVLVTIEPEDIDLLQL